MKVKRFFIYHCEKLILGLSIVLLGLFFWFGYSTPTFDKSDPSKMVAQASQARKYMNDANAWDKISASRQGDDEVIERIMQTPDVSHSSYVIGPTSYPVKRSALRVDARIRQPLKLVATSFLSPLLIQTRRKAVDPLPEEIYQTVKAPTGLGIRPPVRNRSRDFEEEDEDDDDGGSLNQRRPPASRRTRAPKAEEPVDAGTFVSVASSYRTPGLREAYATNRVMSFNMAGVAVTGIIEHKAMWKEFRSRYQSSFGYHPDRDTPRYDYLQVERRIVNNDGSTGEWTDLSSQLASQPDFFPSRLVTAPEVVGPDEYDGIITMPIPPLTGIDYKEFASHPDVELRMFKVPEVEDENAGADPLNIQQEEESLDPLAGGGSGRRQGALGSDARGNDRRPRREEYEPRRGNGRFGDLEVARTADDVTEYQEVNIREEPKKNYKVVRFFDIHGVRSGRTYQYRTRVWLRDPNNEDPELINDVGAINDDEDNVVERGAQRGKSEEEMKFATKMTIANNMIDPRSRQRLRQAREERGANGARTYFVSEPHGENGAWVEIQVPQGQDYLRFARPSPWSEVIEVSVDASPAFVYAGEPVETKRITVSRGTVAEAEPSIKVATGKFMVSGEQLAGVKVPFRAEVRAGDLLDFNQPAHVQHPVTKAIHRVDGVDVTTGSVVLDVSEGEKLTELSRKSPIPYFYPGEILVLNSDGNIHLRNDLEDRGEYLSAMLDPDEVSTFGNTRRRRTSGGSDTRSNGSDTRGGASRNNTRGGSGSNTR